MTTSVEQAKAMFPDMPEEVFDGFLAPLIRDIGWPFRSVYQILDGTDWFRILHPLMLHELNNFKWTRRHIFLKKDALHPRSRKEIDITILNKTEDVLTLFNRDPKPSRDSLAWHEELIVTTGRFFAPVTMVLTPSGFWVLDGIHRISAIIDQKLTETVPVDAWIGEMPEATT